MNKWSIFSRTIVLGVAPAIFMLLALTGFFIHEKFDTLQQQLNRKGELLVQQLGPASEYAVFIKNPSLLEEIVTPVLNESDVVFVEFYDRDNELLLSRRNLTLIDELEELEISNFSSEIELQDVPLESSDLSLSLAGPSEQSPNKIIGRIHLGLTNKQLLANQMDSIMGGILIGLASLLLAAGLALLIARSILKPVKSLSETVKLFKSGILSARVTEYSGGELGILESNINEMAKTLEQAKRRELEHAMVLEQARSDAVEASKAKSKFLAQMSYEMREPMNAAMGSLQLLEASVQASKLRSYVENSLVASTKLIELVDNILDYAQLENNAVELSPSYFDPSRMLQRCTAPFIAMATKKNIDTHVHANEIFNDFLIYADEYQFQKIITHLLSDSFKNTENGTIEVKLAGKLTESADKIFLVLEVIDSGCGYSADKLGKIFHSFGVAHDVHKPYQSNAGLGLAIAKKLTDCMKGTIEVSSAPDQGTRFKLEFVFKVQPQEKIEAKLPPSDSRAPSISGRILVVENNAIDQMVTKDMLNNIGATVDTAISGKIALEKIRQNDYQLIIADANISDLSILELIQRIRAFERAKNQQIPILIFTADVHVSDWHDFLKAGANDFLVKPIEMTALWQKAEQLMLPQESR
ncbi:MAG: response regulator [Gammaproteobacteria bacterium]|nr:response regulator [Gammaproteobacteria bacterium]